MVLDKENRVLHLNDTVDEKINCQASTGKRGWQYDDTSSLIHRRIGKHDIVDITKDDDSISLTESEETVTDITTPARKKNRTVSSNMYRNSNVISPFSSLKKSGFTSTSFSISKHSTGPTIVGCNTKWKDTISFDDDVSTKVSNQNMNIGKAFNLYSVCISFHNRLLCVYTPTSTVLK